MHQIGTVSMCPPGRSIFYKVFVFLISGFWTRSSLNFFHLGHFCHRGVAIFTGEASRNTIGKLGNATDGRLSGAVHPLPPRTELTIHDPLPLPVAATTAVFGKREFPRGRGELGWDGRGFRANWREAGVRHLRGRRRKNLCPEVEVGEGKAPWCWLSSAKV
jgi:hypothetical protein